MGLFGLGLVIWNEEYHIWVVLKKRWILISILTIFGDSQFFTFWWRGGWRGVLETEHVNYQKGKPEPFSLRKFGKEEGERGAAKGCPFCESKALPCCLKWYLPILNKQVTYSHIRDLYIKGCEDENFTTSHNTKFDQHPLERETWPNIVEREALGILNFWIKILFSFSL